MYMTRVTLKLEPHPSKTHGILSTVFPGKRSNQVNETLWRLDASGQNKALIIVSTKKPDWQLITEKTRVYKSDAQNDVECERDKCLVYEPFLTQIKNGQAWSFRLCANPVEHRYIAGKRGKVYACRSKTEQFEWLRRQAEKSGFLVEECSIIGDTWISFDKPARDSATGFNRVRIRAVTFAGVLTVTNADAFRRALTQGIGRGKAYGCGLLTVAKVQP